MGTSVNPVMLEAVQILVKTIEGIPLNCFSALNETSATQIQVMEQDLLTTLYLQRAVLLIQWISSQVHHASGSGGDPKETWHNDVFTVLHCGRIWQDWMLVVFSKMTETSRVFSSMYV